MKFEWDPAKAAANERKHGVTFDEASTVFADVLSVSGQDLEHSRAEALWLTFGISSHGHRWWSLMPTGGPLFVSSARGLRLEKKGKFMKKASVTEDKMKPEYSRADLGPLVRGKYAVRYAKATNVVVIDPALSKAFPNNEAVNNALRSLLAVATASVASKSVGRSGLAQAKRSVG